MPRATSSRLLVFIDTNIFLDFYRDRKSDASMKFLEQIELNKGRLIYGSQIEMEYKKHRQQVILEGLGRFSLPEWNKLSVPAVIAEMQAVDTINRSKDAIKKQHKNLSEKIKSIMEDPVHHDEAYKVLQRIFKTDSEYNLNREKEIRFEIRELAKKRFLLGYPPRKNDDTSFGDAINWEWLIHCAAKEKANVVIVSRDSDYGVSFGDKWYINDWLSQEFKSRVNSKKKVILTGRLSEALKLLKANVTKEMVQAEEELIEEKEAERIETEESDG